jgi:predicted O-linked N-acetylglucosamine transferase (SPINDLY family)
MLVSAKDYQKTLSDIEEIFLKGQNYHKCCDFINAGLCYQQILTLDSRHDGAWHFLGVIALTQNDYHNALKNIERAISLCSTKSIYWNNYGVVLKLLGRNAEAKAAYEKALAIHPDYADAWSNLGQIQLILKQEHHKIEHAVNQALCLVPQHPDALSHLAELRYRQGRYQECTELLQKLLTLRKNDIALLRQIAECYASVNRHEKAVEFLSQAVSLQPDNAEIRHRFGTMLGESGKISESKQQFRKASLFSNGKDIWRWKHLWYCPVYFDNTQQIDDYWQQLNSDLDEAIAEENVYGWKALAAEGFTSSFHLPHHNKCCREIKEKFTRLFALSFKSFQRPELKYHGRKSGKIRVGFLVTPGHEGGFLRYTSGIIERLNRDRFEIVLIYHQSTLSKYRRFSNNSHITHLVFDWNFETTVKIVSEAGCDIIYYWKAGADVWNFFLPMTRLAPIQFTSWGTHGTSGIRHIDYSLSHDLAESENAQEHYTEKLFLINEAPTFQPRIPMPKSCLRKELGLPEDGAVYFCPHRLSKYHPDYDHYLKEILEKDSKGHLLLLIGDSPTLAEKFKNRMKRNIGSSLFKRMIFMPKQTPYCYNRLIAVSTMILDSPVYSGGLTAYDAFSFGVPCVTQTGPLLVQRYPTACYKAMGIKEAVTTCREDYVRTAVQLGTDRDYRQYFSDQIKERSCVLFDQSGVIQQFETFFESIISEYPNNTQECFSRL